MQDEKSDSFKYSFSSYKKKARLPVVGEEEIKEVQYNVRKIDPYPMEGTKTRNIIMLGRSGSGKTTAIEVIKDICAKPRNVGLFSDTMGAKFSSFSLDDKNNKTKYTLNIIDTPGVQEVRKLGEDTRSDEAIIETVKFCLKNEVTKLHCLFIFVSFGGKINKVDIEAFKIYLEMFKNEKVRIAFCITRSEGMSAEEEKKVVDDLTQDQYFSEVLSLPNVTVFFAGCVNDFMYKNSADKEILFGHYVDIHERREKILKYIFEADDNATMLYDFPIVSASINSMNAQFDLVEGIIRKLQSLEDFKTGPVQNMIQDFNDALVYMKKNEGLFQVPALYERFIALKSLMRKLKSKMDEESWVNFSSQVIL